MLDGLTFTISDTLDEDMLRQYENRQLAESIISSQVCYFCSEIKNAYKKAMGLKSFNIGIIGGGNVGNKVARDLLKLGMKGADILIATRRVETVSLLTAFGVDNTHTNISLASTARILILACLPSQIKTIASEIRNHLRKGSIIISVVAAVSTAKLQQLFTTSSVIHTVIDPTIIEKKRESIPPEEFYNDTHVDELSFELLKSQPDLIIHFVRTLAWVFNVLVYNKDESWSFALKTMFKYDFPSTSLSRSTSPSLNSPILQTAETVMKSWELPFNNEKLFELLQDSYNKHKQRPNESRERERNENANTKERGDNNMRDRSESVNIRDRSESVNIRDRSESVRDNISVRERSESVRGSTFKERGESSFRERSESNSIAETR